LNRRQSNRARSFLQHSFFTLLLLPDRHGFYRPKAQQKRSSAGGESELAVSAFPRNPTRTLGRTSHNISIGVGIVFH
jgi:hypothetical protein